MFIMIMLASILILPLFLFVLVNILSKKSAPALSPIFALCVAALQVVSSVLVLIDFCITKSEFINFSILWTADYSLGAGFFTVDLFSLIVLTVVGIISFVTVLVSMSPKFMLSLTQNRDRRISFYSVFFILLLGMNGIVIVSDFFSMYVFLEITAVCSFILISLFKAKKALEGSLKYLIMSAIATAFILSGMALLFMNTGSLSLEVLQSALSDISALPYPQLAVFAFVLIVTGFFIKAGIVPFHSWVADSYQGARAAVSILLGGIVTKVAGVYGLIRLFAYIITPQGVQQVFYDAMMLFGLLTVFAGAFLALYQNNFKRMLAFSSISQVGYIILGVSTGSALGFCGAILHFINHAIFKSTLFVNSSAIEERVGFLDLEQMGGLAKQMPITGFSSILALLSAAGIPPLAGFWSKLIIIIALFRISPLAAVLALIASIITLAYFLRLQAKVFFGKPKQFSKEISEASLGIKISSLFLSVLNIGLGAVFPLAILFLQETGIF